MTTARDIVTRALRILSVVARDVSVESHDAETGLEALNQMLHGWRLRGVDVGLVDDYTLNDEFTKPGDEFREATAFLLAEALAPEFDVTLNREAATKAINSWRLIQRYFLCVEDQDTDRGLQRMPSSLWAPFRSRSY